ncbi:MAG: ferredoxin--NADP reductase [Hyphomicrobiaceae bacterium]|nr:ferredoxin--NADP reductase [Hyphomicrobiaceae bacterium]
MSAFNEETVIAVRHWTESLFSFTTSRSQSFRFQNGQFTMIGLSGENGRPLVRAYSMVSTSYDEELEFLSIKIPDGPLTSKLQHIAPGDRILVSRKPTGTLVIDNLEPGRNLFLFSTGTGLAPFMSIVRDPETYERFEKVVLVHGCRQVAELAYGDRLRHDLPGDELIGDMVRDKLVYYPTVTREPFENRGRITDIVESGRLFSDLSLPVMEPGVDRAMLCGSPQMLASMTDVLETRGFQEGSSGEPGQYVIEKAFVEK